MGWAVPQATRVCGGAGHAWDTRVHNRDVWDVCAEGWDVGTCTCRGLDTLRTCVQRAGTRVEGWDMQGHVCAQPGRTRDMCAENWDVATCVEG